MSTGEKTEIDVLFDRWTVMSHVDMVVLERLLCWHGTGESVLYSQSQLLKLLVEVKRWCKIAW